MTEQEILAAKARIYDLSEEINALGRKQQELLAEIQKLKEQIAAAMTEEVNADK